MTLTEMRRVLDARGIQLTKSLGQNFLFDAHQLRRIVAAAELVPGQQVLEIGPGLGPLTEALRDAGARVLAVEKDVRLIEVLRDRWPGAGGPEVIHADALEWLRSGARSWAGWKMVSNLPYSVGTPILVELAQAELPPERMVVTLQLEVAERLAAAAGAAAYGLLSLLVGLRYTVGRPFRIPASCFFPVPAVDSACVVLHRRPAPLLSGEGARRFEALVRLGFSQRRKMMAKLLRARWTDAALQDAFAVVGLDLRVRAEQVTLAQFVELARRLGESEPRRDS